jgi:hypothetical protein
LERPDEFKSDFMVMCLSSTGAFGSLTSATAKGSFQGLPLGESKPVADYATCAAASGGAVAGSCCDYGGAKAAGGTSTGGGGGSGLAATAAAAAAATAADVVGSGSAYGAPTADTDVDADNSSSNNMQLGFLAAPYSITAPLPRVSCLIKVCGQDLHNLSWQIPHLVTQVSSSLCDKSI